MSDEPYILITADTHAGGSHAQYRDYLDPKYRDQFDEWRGGYKNPSQEHYGEKKLRNWDLKIRLFPLYSSRRLTSYIKNDSIYLSYFINDSIRNSL